jgi:type II secretory ATPase GspE/PulE/Tfp pilus assembly ATPase PilB-like protein
MIGEIRDDETAKVAVEASMTGHLVLSTLHTNSAPETLARLLDLGVASFNLADAALAVLAQRLARQICGECGETYELTGDEIDGLVGEYLSAAPRGSPSRAERDKLVERWRKDFAKGGALTAMHRVGCHACNNTGYRGRLGIHELLVVTPEIRRLIRSNSSTGAIFAEGIAGGMKTLRQDGIEKVLGGLTDLAEVRAVCI